MSSSSAGRPRRHSPTCRTTCLAMLENRVVILTGSGEEWPGVRATPGQSAISSGLTVVLTEGRSLLMHLLNILNIEFR